MAVGMSFLFVFLFCIYYTNSEKCAVGNYLRGGRCERCLPECRSGQVVIGRCNQTSNVKCECPVNEYWDGPLVICKKCTVCGLGQISILNCSHDENRKCEDCPKGTFAKTLYHCEKCSHCEEGEVVHRRCNASHNTWCITPYTKQLPPFIRVTEKPVVPPTNEPEVQDSTETNKTLVIILVVIVVFIIVMVLACICWKCCAGINHKNKYQEPASLTDDSVVEALNVKKRSPPPPSPPPIRDNGKLVRDLPPDVIEELAQQLNPQGLNNWKTLAGKLCFSQTKIGNFDLQKKEACQSLLSEWGTERANTVYILYGHLHNMKRDDCTEVLRKYLEENPV